MAAPAQAGVAVVPSFDPAEYADRAAIGWVVPGAGPTTSTQGLASLALCIDVSACFCEACVQCFEVVTDSL